MNRLTRSSRVLFSILAFAVPTLTAYILYYQFTTPTLDLFLSSQNPNVVYQVVPGGLAESAGLRAGDVILTGNGIPFAAWRPKVVGETCLLEVERNGQRLAFNVTTVPVAQTTPLIQDLALGVVILTFWAVGALLLWRRYQRPEVRLLFLLTQTTAIALMWPLPQPRPWPVPDWIGWLSIACFSLVGPLLLHFYLTFPAPLGSPRQRAWGLGAAYGLAPIGIAGGLSSSDLGIRLNILYTACVVTIATGVLVYAYLRRATPDGRRRLRVIVLGNILAAFPPIFLYLLPSVTGSYYRISGPTMRLFLVFAPLSYLFATARHRLFGVDRLLNRALVYALLSLGVFCTYLVPFLFIYQSLQSDPLIELAVVTGLTLFVGLAFDQTRVQVERFVDRLFYGGWYDYPRVVETISDALARSIERDQLSVVLTRQLPKLMQLHEGQLSLEDEADRHSITVQPSHLQIPLTFQNQARGVWVVGGRRDGQDFTAADRRILKTVAREAEVALGNVLLVEMLRRQLDELRASRETLGQAQRQLLSSREAERGRLARELHDGPIQDLVGLNLQLGLLPTGNGPLPEEPLKSVRADVRKLLADLREVCAKLRPPMLDTMGLGAALRVLADDWATQSGIPVKLDLPPDTTLRSLPGEVAVNLYRLVQEALANVAHHATARQVALHASWDESRLRLTVQDDGRGFVVPDNLNAFAANGHFGLIGIQERATLIGASWSVESAPGAGTAVRVTWPGDANPALPK